MAIHVLSAGIYRERCLPFNRNGASAEREANSNDGYRLCPFHGHRTDFDAATMADGHLAAHDGHATIDASVQSLGQCGRGIVDDTVEWTKARDEDVVHPASEVPATRIKSSWEWIIGYARTVMTMPLRPARTSSRRSPPIGD